MKEESYPHFYKRMAYFHLTKANETFSLWKIFMNNVREDCYMNFNTMVKKLNKDIKAFRPTWGKGQFLFLSKTILAHNTQYYTNDTYQEKINGYVYVPEIDDLLSEDWAIVENE